MDTGKDDCILADPHIAADDGIAFQRKIGRSRRIHVPAFQRVKRKGRYGIHLMVCAVHHKFNTGSDLTELADDQFVSIPPHIPIRLVSTHLFSPAIAAAEDTA